MPIDGLTIIGESINDTVPSTGAMFESGDIEGILELARMQDAGGAGYLDVNIGLREPDVMSDTVRRIQEVSALPLSIDSPDPEIVRAGLEAYDVERAGGRKPIVNSVSQLRMEMFDLYSIQPFRPILLASEFENEEDSGMCRTAEQTYGVAKFLIEAARRIGVANDDMIIDCGLAPLGADHEGYFQRLVEALKLIRGDSDCAGVHGSVGMTNFSFGLPPKRPDGLRVKSALESAFLTLTMPLGMDTIIGSVKRKYEILPPDHPAVVCLEDCLKLEGMDVVLRVRDFYR